MVRSRVGKRDLLGSTPPPRTPNEQLLTRLVGSPWAILIVFPAIVLVVGGVLTVSAQDALRASNTEMAEGRMRDQARLVAEHLDEALGQAEPLLDDLAEAAIRVESTDPPEALGHTLRDLLHGRPGISYVSVSFPDGTFEGAYLEDDGTIRFQVSRVNSGGGQKRVFGYHGRGPLAPIRDESTTYDPRVRPFYALATSRRGRVWTKPYAFAGSNYTGITRAEAIYRANASGQDELHAVLTVDFDVARLSTLLERQQFEGVRALLVGPDGALLADPRAKAAIEGLRRPGEVLRFQDLRDPVLDAFFRAEQSAGTGALRFDSGGARHLAAAQPVGRDRALGWRVVYLAPEATFLSSLHAYSKKSWWIGAVSLLVAVGLSIGFARLVVRVRREAADARAAAKRANQRAQELGSYRLLECLGKGGMGEVWRAEHRLLARQAAIKLIRHEEGEAPSAEAQERFRREAQTLAALSSRSTIELFDYGVTEDGTFFYVMELLDGLDLDSLVSVYGPQPPARVIPLLMQACRSLGEAHEAGLVHRDVKPANMFVCRAADEADVLKVLDFGLVRAVSAENQVIYSVPPPNAEAAREALGALESRQEVESGASPQLTRADHVMGTPEFMAPEQAMGGEVDGRADLYALGAIGFWLLTGRTLFQRQNMVAVLVAHMTEPPPSLSERCPFPLPSGLEQVLADCLAKSPDARPQTAKELYARLRAVEVPTEQAWTEEAAAAWWAEHRPLGSQNASAKSAALSATMAVSPSVTASIAIAKADALGGR